MVLHEQTFLEGAAEDGPVCHWSVEVSVPGVQMCVEVHERHWTVLAGDGPQHRQCDRVVAADRNDPSVAAAEDLARVRLDLVDGVGNAVRAARHVPGVDDLELRERRDAEIDVETGAEVAGRLPHGHRPEASTRPVGGAPVEGHAQDRDVVIADLAEIWDPGERARAGETRR